MFHMFDCITNEPSNFKCVKLNKIDNEMFFYVCMGGQMVKDANGSIEYKGGRIITLLVNVHIPLDEFVPLVCGKLNLDSNSVIFYYT